MVLEKSAHIPDTERRTPTTPGIQRDHLWLVVSPTFSPPSISLTFLTTRIILIKILRMIRLIWLPDSRSYFLRAEMRPGDWSRRARPAFMKDLDPRSLCRPAFLQS